MSGVRGEAGEWKAVTTKNEWEWEITEGVRREV